MHENLSIISFILFLNLSLYGQIDSCDNIPEDISKHLNEMGTEISPFLNNYECMYFKAVFKDTADYDFAGKKIAFIYSGLSNKKKFFDQEKEWCAKYGRLTASSIYFFNERQKEESGGYDAVVVSWSKRVLREEDLAKRLKEEKPNK